MARKVTVYVYGMRHGKALTGAKGDELLPEGAEQVLNSGCNNLKGIRFSGFYSSFRSRAYQTAQLVSMNNLLELALRDLNEHIDARVPDSAEITQRHGFDYADELIEQCGGGEAMNATAKQVATDRGSNVVSIQDWMDAVPLWTGTLRDQVTQEIRDLAINEAVINPEAETLNVFVASHSPIIDTAAVDMAAMPRLNEADIVKYTVEVTITIAGYARAEITASEYIPRGF